MTSEMTTGAIGTPRRVWLGVLFAVVAGASLVACAPAATDSEWLALGRRSTCAALFALYAYGHFRWPHARWPKRGERAAALLVVGYLACVVLALTS
ncbi:hypothetical protein [Mumia sp. Pv 4-285]|uniref:hypothetical protein n=1 Tax=Mumia qirimensis TaxID=3234852 RepID=UPI00351DA604